MTTYVLDAGGLIELERNNRGAWSRLLAARSGPDAVLVPTGVIGQVWRGTPPQARLSQALQRCKAIPLDVTTARAAGVLCGLTSTADVIDATVAVVAHNALRFDDVWVITSDPHDIGSLLSALRSGAGVISV